ncbi:S-layer homology domain-containing protein [Paenibacillus tepidiphilus]|uniref:S-layer homology domain-containing protein n=1 Tax=Paenibacillus tepidiphilus TaxID=2608683 RepID=UPI00123BD2DD|nr:S-layer homology domain-containing protein [Paenibacillus tepidiphilus]
MSLKKKLAVSTLAASMAAASFAGFPFSTEGLAKHLGVSVASAAKSKEEVKTIVKNVYSKLTNGQALYNYKEQAKTISQDEFEAIFAPVLDKVVAKAKLSTDDVKTSYNIFQTASSVVYDVYADGFTGVQGKLVVDENVALLNKLAKAAGVDSLTFDDLSEFVFGTNGLEAELRALIGTTSIESVLENDALIDQIVDKVLARKTGGADSLTVSEVLTNLGVTPSDVKSALRNFNKELPTAQKAALSLASAYLKAYPTSDGGYTGGTGGGTVATTPTLNAATGVYDVSKLVSIVGDKATLKLVDADVLKAFDAFLAANSGKTGLTFTFDLGTVKAKIVEVPLSKVIVEAAKTKGIANFAIAFNGLTTTLPLGQFADALTLTTTTLEDTAVTSVSSQKLASKVYDFDLKVGGVATTVFKQPLTIKLPLANTTGLDKELLSVSKLVYGALEFHGGVVDGEHIIEKRDTFSSYAVVENKVSFTDTALVQAWAGRQIQVVAAKGAIEGVGAGKFAPKNNVTRAEFAKMLVRGLNLENSTATENFSDVSSTAWYAPYVAVAAEKGIITGRSATQFDPNASITRAEMATMIARAVKSLNPAATSNTASLSKFSDASKIAASLKEGVAFAASNNLVIGNAGKFNPNDTANRAEAAVIIYRTINFK